MKRTTVSVIIPCYNCSAYIEQTLQSLAAQRRVPDEVICVNDGSTDHTQSILEAASRDAVLNIRLLNQPNRGVSAARNAGIEAACGDLLLFLDADDGYAAGFIQAVVDHCEGYDTVYSWFTRDREQLCEAPRELEKIPCTKIEAMSDFMYNKGRCHTGAFAYRRELIHSANLRFTPGARYGEDWEFTSKYLDLCRNALCIPHRLMFYRRAEGSAMTKVTYAHADAIAAAERTEAFLQANHSACLELFRGYMKHRAIFATAHTFARAGERELFRRLRQNYDVKKSMNVLLRCKAVSKKVRLAALCYCINPAIFFHIAGKR